jgi:hypothetical protein
MASVFQFRARLGNAHASPVQSWLHALRVEGRLLFPLTGANNYGAMLMIKRVADQQFAGFPRFHIASASRWA